MGVLLSDSLATDETFMYVLNVYIQSTIFFFIFFIWFGEKIVFRKNEKRMKLQFFSPKLNLF